ncbi:cyanophycinase [Ferruginibacter sp. HRS2-29]|uniref:cyanophycinase n=1 Tax=Ferruginibacter sp. HRS2-29 TaxID=2487334 RepID=UPI0020CCB0A2|nr:cyanophycinase [Ferruginibacter sp. HRS2-29]MCP9753342.1 cyanophycinase [Ferruginibacter sp. HRS2-29]
MLKIISLLLIAASSPVLLLAQKKSPQGNLFIIGGGNRGPELMKTMLDVAKLSPADYIVVLPMASEEPDSAFFYMKKSLEGITANVMVCLRFDSNDAPGSRLDSLGKAKLIFISGGDQSRFMKSIKYTPVASVIQQAYNSGATIAGTSAGAAVMSKQMITGKELISNTGYNATFKKIVKGNIEFEPGLGLLKNAIVDQHFIVRSRYNRLISALSEHPDQLCIGIDEATAIIVKPGNKISVTGEAQVLVLSKPRNTGITAKGLIYAGEIVMSIYVAGQEFAIR